MGKKIALFIFGCLFGFLMGLGIHHGYAKYVNPEMYMSPNVENVQSLPTNVSYEVVYVRGKQYVIFSNGSGSDIEVQRLN